MEHRAPPCAACTVLSLTPSQVPVEPERLNGTRLLLRLEAGADRGDWSVVLEDLRRRGARVGLHVVGVPTDADPVLRASGDALLIEVHGGNADQLTYGLKRAFVTARGANENTTLVMATDAALLTSLLRQDIGAYVDAVMTLSGSGEIGADARPLRWVAASGRDAIGTLSSAADVMAASRPETGESQVWSLSAEALAPTVLRDLAALQPLLPDGLVFVPDRTISCGSTRLQAFLNPQTLDLFAVSFGCPRLAPIVADVQGADIERFEFSPLSLFRVRGGEAERFAENTNVTGSRSLTIEEVIARHQAAAARQSAAIRTDIATGTLTLTFEAPGFPAPVSVTSRTIIFRSHDRTDLQQQDIRLNGVSFKSAGGVPRLPIIEPERVAAPPLAIALTEAYRYRLTGRETIGKTPCYIVAFAPRNRKAALYEGRAWIAAETFALVRVSAVQTGLRGPVTASEQTDDFQESEGHWLLSRSDVRQTYEGAAVRTPIHRLMVIDRHEINSAAFDARRASAYASTDVMLRDTAQGFRYLARESAPASPTDARAPAQPVVAGRADRVRTLAFGVIVDPNISRPLPFAGISYADFNLLGTGAQLNAFFGGSYGQLAFSAPSLGGTRWQLGGRAFGIAASYNDRAFVQGREQYTHDIRQRPAQASVWMLRPISPRVSVRAGYQWDYTKYEAGDTTAADFTVPVNQVVHAAFMSLDLQHVGWQASLWWSPARRAGWRPWGIPAGDDYRESQHDFQRFGAVASRSIAVAPRVATRVEMACMSGRDLDRFSRYSFGTFDNRLRGYPSALIRYDRGAVLRTALAWSAAKAVRIDLFADTAEVRDRGFGDRLRNYTGFGAALEAPGPLGTLLALEWGYGVRGINADGRVGTHVVRVTGYKVF